VEQGVVQLSRESLGSTGVSFRLARTSLDEVYALRMRRSSHLFRASSLDSE
jgi:hypothetical protein